MIISSAKGPGKGGPPEPYLLPEQPALTTLLRRVKYKAGHRSADYDKFEKVNVIKHKDVDKVIIYARKQEDAAKIRGELKELLGKTDKDVILDERGVYLPVPPVAEDPETGRRLGDANVQYATQPDLTVPTHTSAQPTWIQLVADQLGISQASTVIATFDRRFTLRHK